MENEKAIEIFNKWMDCKDAYQADPSCDGNCFSCEYYASAEEEKEAMLLAISALEKQELERWRRYPEEKPNGQEMVFVTLPAYTDRNGNEHCSGVICAYHIDNCHGGWWGRSDGATYGALGMCDVDPVAWRPLPEAYTEEEK